MQHCPGVGNLEVQLQRQLDLARIIPLCFEATKIGRLEIRGWNIEGRGVRQIEKFCAEFRTESFFHYELLEHRKINPALRGATQLIASTTQR